jgi:hypothetical protein
MSIVAAETEESKNVIRDFAASYHAKNHWLPDRNPLHNLSLFFRRVGNEEMGSFVLTENAAGLLEVPATIMRAMEIFC